MHILIPALHRPSKPTGVCRHAVNLAQCLADTASVTEITLVIGTWQREYFEKSFDLDSPKIHLVTVHIKNSSLARNQWFMFGLPKLAQQLEPDIIHMSFPSLLLGNGFRYNHRYHSRYVPLRVSRKFLDTPKCGSTSFCSSAFATVTVLPAFHTAHWRRFAAISLQSGKKRRLSTTS